MGQYVGENYIEAARRHMADSELLASSSRWDNAGHLLGFAAECAVKSRIKPLCTKPDELHCHFPKLVAVARKHLNSRRDAKLYMALKTPDLLAGWTVALRYEANSSVVEAVYARWRRHTLSLLSAAGLNR